MSSLSRRRFLSLATAAGVAALKPPQLLAAPTQEFTFLHITDTHIQPELHATEGCAMAFRKARTLHADLCIQGGDHIFDGLKVPLSRSMELYRLYGETEQQLGLKTYHTIGNHDLLGIAPDSVLKPDAPGYGKAYFQEHVGPLYQSFDHKGVHFIVLDTIGIGPNNAYYGHIDAAQLDWLKADLAKLAPGTPVIVSAHIPLVSAFQQYIPTPHSMDPVHNSLVVANAYEVLPLFEGHNVLGVLQGHTHINERVEWNGVPYLTSGAVSGDWWKGIRMGTPEGFTVCTVRNGKLTTRYETYGFHADPVAAGA